MISNGEDSQLNSFEVNVPIINQLPDENMLYFFTKGRYSGKIQITNSRRFHSSENNGKSNRILFVFLFKDIPVHRVILASASTVFDLLFSQPPIDSKQFNNGDSPVNEQGVWPFSSQYENSIQMVLEWIYLNSW